MGKKVLAIYYSQSGQLADIVAPADRAAGGRRRLRRRSSGSSRCRIIPFPGPPSRFYSVMPDCVLGVTGRLAPLQLKETAYDLIVLGYQAWFLYPSIPVNTLFTTRPSGKC